MIIVMKPKFSEDNLRNVINTIEGLGLTAHLSRGEHTTLVGVVGDKRRLLEKNPELFPGVDRVIQVSETYKLANKKFKAEPTIIDVDGVKIGGDNFVIMAGPCAVESHDQLMQTAAAAKAGGAQILRGGAYKPRTSPYSFQGMGTDGLELLLEAKKATGLPIVTELMSPKYCQLFEEKVDLVQIGARNMQNFDLLKEVGKMSKPVLLKRGLANSYEEWIMSAEYIMAEGNENVILCERGIRTFETYTRNTLDISAIPAIRQMSHLPIIVDPSHAAGMYWMVEPLAMAAIAVGADGLMVEVHNDPPHAKCDGQQSLTPEKFQRLMDKARPMVELVGKHLV